MRETLSERRNRKGADVPFWYLSPELVKRFNLPGDDVEAVVAAESTSIDWLQLRFGGKSFSKEFDLEQLRQYAMDLPPAPAFRDISA